MDVELVLKDSKDARTSFGRVFSRTRRPKNAFSELGYKPYGQENRG